ncbi:MAG: cupin domain-containing protein [Roseomonas sp.]|jgi:mannose-6-phosphate isomerase-like protein (cupin superfamily)|nr:cupin domain-containing protein [Roseomonas sp.]
MTVRRFNAFGWENVPVLSYKEGGPYKDVTRQILFEGAESLPVQWRYFEVQPGGHSTLERHEHIHWVLILRGRGACLVGDEITDIAEHDLIEIAPLQWHQFRAAEDAPLGFLCLVAAERDRPQLPSEDDLAGLRQDAKIADFIRP